MKPEFAEALSRTQPMLRAFAGIAPPDQKDAWLPFENFMVELATNGWTRGDIHSLVSQLASEAANSMPEECYDAMTNYLDGLTGWCSATHIVRLPGDPQEDEELTRYAREMKWLK